MGKFYIFKAIMVGVMFGFVLITYLKYKKDKNSMSKFRISFAIFMYFFAMVYIWVFDSKVDSIVYRYLLLNYPKQLSGVAVTKIDDKEYVVVDLFSNKGMFEVLEIERDSENNVIYYKNRITEFPFPKGGLELETLKTKDIKNLKIIK